jgi:hypothetical protein
MSQSVKYHWYHARRLSPLWDQAVADRQHVPDSRWRYSVAGQKVNTARLPLSLGKLPLGTGRDDDAEPHVRCICSRGAAERAAAIRWK